MMRCPVKIILDDLSFLLIEILIIIIEVKLRVALIARFVMTFTVYNFNIGMVTAIPNLKMGRKGKENVVR